MRKLLVAAVTQVLVITAVLELRPSECLGYGYIALVDDRTGGNTFAKDSVLNESVSTTLTFPLILDQQVGADDLGITTSGHSLESMSLTGPDDATAQGRSLNAQAFVGGTTWEDHLILYGASWWTPTLTGNLAPGDTLDVFLRRTGGYYDVGTGTVVDFQHHFLQTEPGPFFQAYFDSTAWAYDTFIFDLTPPDIFPRPILFTDYGLLMGLEVDISITHAGGSLQSTSFSQVTIGDDFGFVSSGSVPLPEPSTLVLAGLGLVGLGLVALRRKYRRA